MLCEIRELGLARFTPTESPCQDFSGVLIFQDSTLIMCVHVIKIESLASSNLDFDCVVLFQCDVVLLCFSL